MYLKNENFDCSMKKQIQNEISILQLLQHENIMKLVHHVENAQYIILILEFKSHQTLAKVLNNEPMEENDCKKIFRQMGSAVEYCHRSGIIHRDIKLQNIMLFHSQVQIIDFGFAIECGQELDDYIGTPAYLSPEIIEKGQYNGYKSDVWALGICLYVMINGFYPFKGRNEQQLN